MGKVLRSEESQSVLGQTTTGLFPLIHSQLFPFANETYPSVRSVLPDELLDGHQRHFEFLESNLRVLIDGLQVGFSEGQLLNFGEVASLVRAVVDMRRLRKKELGICMTCFMPCLIWRMS